MQPKYKRILLKLSGEALAGDQKFGLNHDVIAPVVDQIVQLHEMGVQVGLVIGGGNFWRGVKVRIWTVRQPTIWVCLLRL